MSSTPADQAAPFLVARADAGPGRPGTGLIVLPRAAALPAVWVTGVPAGGVPAGGVPAGGVPAGGVPAGGVLAGGVLAGGLDPWDAAAGLGADRPGPMLPEHGAGWFGRPGLSGYRLDTSGGVPFTGRDWSPLFRPVRTDHDGPRARLEAADDEAGLRLVTEVEAVAGGAIRARHTVTNTGPQPYAVSGLEVVFPLPEGAAEILDFTGRWAAERTPQRHQITDGLWLREGRRGHTGHDSATVLIAGVPGFTFGGGEVYGLHVAWSGNTVHRVERLPSGTTTIGGGELLLPGEITLAQDQSYATPWVYLAAACGLDALAAQFHGYLRSLPAHPGSPRPVNLNVWEAVYFDHDLDKLTSLADIAADAGVERYVLDDGWFRGRRGDHAGLGDWRVDEQVWPGGLHRLVDHVRARGMQFGLWFEPEMVNPDSDLFRAHPDWILSAGHRVPPLQRNQLVLDLTRPEVTGYLLEQISSVLSEYEISYLKWDCNRDIIDAGSATRAGAPAAHAQAEAVYALLDELSRRHPEVEWESCAGGGGRVDLAMLGRVQRIWVSDMTDALARQSIQRWTGQLVPPEYLGAHVSAPFSHQTGRYLPLGLRGATALFGHFGVEWDITGADQESLAELTAWIALYKRHRALIHSGLPRRVDTPDDTAWMHGIVAADQSAALMSYVQLDVPRHDRQAALRVPGLDPGRRYLITDITPGERRSRWPRQGTGPDLPGAGISGAALGDIGIAIPVQRPQTATILLIEAMV
jgi:alpha-galactosidase